MPYCKLYNKPIYDSDIKCLLLKIKYENNLDDKTLQLIYRSNNLSIIYEIIIGIISTLIDLSKVDNKEISKGLYLIEKDKYRKVVINIFGRDFYYILRSLSDIRNNASHSLSESIKRFDYSIKSLGLTKLIKMILTLHKKTGMGRELAICVYEMFRDDINIQDLFESEMQYKVFDSLLMPAQRENLFESALDFLLIRSDYN